MDSKELITAVASADLTRNEIERLWAILSDKAKLLRAKKTLEAKAALFVGAVAETRGLTPKALNGKRGVITEIRKTRADIQLIDTLPTGKAARYVRSGILRGIPVACLTVVESGQEYNQI